MGVFDKFKKPKDVKEPDRSGGPAVSSFDDVKKNIEIEKGSGAAKGPSRLSATDQAVIKKLYSPENGNSFSSSYFDIRLLWTGDEIFKLDEKERASLNLPEATLLQELTPDVSPWVHALVILGRNFVSLMAVKEFMHKARVEGKAPHAPAAPGDPSKNGKK